VAATGPCLQSGTGIPRHGNSHAERWTVQPDTDTRSQYGPGDGGAADDNHAARRDRNGRRDRDAGAGGASNRRPDLRRR